MFFLLLVLTGSLVMAQTVQISGTVTSSEDGLPMPGVNVTVKGTTFGAITDINGNFTVVAPPNSKTLVFSFIGYVTGEMPIQNKTKIDVVLKLVVRS